ncbi:TPA: hypothetical protein ACH3X3_000295 [Trebouxia sp. C0006]
MSAATSFAYETFAPDRKLMSLDHFSHSQLSILTSLAGEDPAGADRPTLLDTLTKRMQNTSEQDWTLTDRLGKTPGRRGGLLCSYEDQLNIVGGARSADQAFNIRCDPMSRLWEPVQRKREPLDGLLERPCGVVQGNHLYTVGRKSLEVMFGNAQSCHLANLSCTDTPLMTISGAPSNCRTVLPVA